MTSVEKISAVAPMTGYGHVEIRKSLDAGKVAPEVKETIVKKRLERQRKIISPLYNSRGKLIEYDNSGRHLDMYG